MYLHLPSTEALTSSASSSYHAVRVRLPHEGAFHTGEEKPNGTPVLE